MVHYLTVLVIVTMYMVLARKSLCRFIIRIFMTVLLLTGCSRRHLSSLQI
ncbi:hypothetical protein T4A_9230 [Trichinella pseudospiralis]|uniref:Uncharacterized protein n=1 Tax=Trichinella pseudospiralis TaxID=6337 RepID=A0A0V0XN09_TRIPS|nr:hypothetical protein T4E_3107 [Trichinella pseudospiralis]KRY64902.1 hypothetical protein T4A_9230 [Trichinella pseudospiralis]